MNTWGGARPSAGRKSKAEKHATAIEKAEGKVVDHLPALVDRMLLLGYGVRQTRKTPQGEEVVFTTPPNFRALAYLIDRILGKATERQEISGPDGDPVWIEMQQRFERDLDKVYGPAAPLALTDETG